MSDLIQRLRLTARMISDGDWMADAETAKDLRDAADALDALQRERDEQNTWWREQRDIWNQVLADADARDDWQDIATAPKDEDVLLLWAEGWGVQPGYWDDDAQLWRAVETQGLTGGRHPATHWKPLPAPPRTP